MKKIPLELRYLTRHLHKEGRLRVWSVIVTIMGEIAQPDGGEISMATLLDICGALDIEPQAVRTAMSRLSKNGLVIGKREGRIAFYRFSAKGLADYKDAAEVIYAAPKQIHDWTFAFGADGTPVKSVQMQFVKNPPLILGGRCYVWPSEVWEKISNNMASDLMVFEAHPKDLPTWAYDSVLPRLNYQTCQMISKCCQALIDGSLMSDHAILARVLLIHFWRRLVLRYPTVEAPLSASQWPFAKVHRNIAAVYPLLLEASKTTNGAEKRFR